MKTLKILLVITLLGIIACLVMLYDTYQNKPVPAEIKKEYSSTEKDSIEKLVEIDTINNYYSIDNHELVQFKSDAIMHSTMCQECLKRLEP